MSDSKKQEGFLKLSHSDRYQATKMPGMAGWIWLEILAWNGNGITRNRIIEIFSDVTTKTVDRALKYLSDQNLITNQDGLWTKMSTTMDKNVQQTDTPVDKNVHDYGQKCPKVWTKMSTTTPQPTRAATIFTTPKERLKKKKERTTLQNPSVPSGFFTLDEKHPNRPVGVEKPRAKMPLPPSSAPPPSQKSALKLMQEALMMVWSGSLEGHPPSAWSRVGKSATELCQLGYSSSDPPEIKAWLETQNNFKNVDSYSPQTIAREAGRWRSSKTVAPKTLYPTLEPIGDMPNEFA